MLGLTIRFLRSALTKLLVQFYELVFNILYYTVVLQLQI